MSLVSYEDADKRELTSLVDGFKVGTVLLGIEGLADENAKIIL